MPSRGDPRPWEEGGRRRRTATSPSSIRVRRSPPSSPRLRAGPGRIGRATSRARPGPCASWERARQATRSCPIVAAAASPRPTTSPTAITKLSSESSSASYQSPPTSRIWAADRYSPWTDACARTGRSAGSIARWSSSAAARVWSDVWARRRACATCADKALTASFTSREGRCCSSRTRTTAPIGAPCTTSGSAHTPRPSAPEMPKPAGYRDRNASVVSARTSRPVLKASLEAAASSIARRGICDASSSASPRTATNSRYPSSWARATPPAMAFAIAITLVSTIPAAASAVEARDSSTDSRRCDSTRARSRSAVARASSTAAKSLACSSARAPVEARSSRSVRSSSSRRREGGKRNASAPSVARGTFMGTTAVGPSGDSVPSVKTLIPLVATRTIAWSSSSGRLPSAVVVLAPSMVSSDAPPPSRTGTISREEPSSSRSPRVTDTAPVASRAHRTMDSTTASTSWASSSAAAIVCIASLRLASARNRRRDASSASSRRLARLMASWTRPASASAAKSRPSGPTRSVFPGTTTPTSHRRPPTDTSRVTASGATAGSPYKAWPPSNTTSWVSAGS